MGSCKCGAMIRTWWPFGKNDKPRIVTIIPHNNSCPRADNNQKRRQNGNNKQIRS